MAINSYLICYIRLDSFIVTYNCGEFFGRDAALIGVCVCECVREGMKKSIRHHVEIQCARHLSICVNVRWKIWIRNEHAKPNRQGREDKNLDVASIHFFRPLSVQSLHSLSSCLPFRASIYFWLLKLKKNNNSSIFRESTGNGFACLNITTARVRKRDKNYLVQLHNSVSAEWSQQKKIHVEIASLKKKRKML